ncbi:MAG: sulfite exporter TauE/SafE family protein [Oscillospiraceae bacterium]|nr:sulfite exporter TauE/SafE family protein [Oscillospiraceae bacterium]
METERCEIRIRGMICRSCTDEVLGMLLRTKGVVKANVSYRKALAAVSYDPSLITPEDLEKRIKAWGYDTGERSRTERLLDLGCVIITGLLVWLLLRWGGASLEIGDASFGALFLVGLSTSPHCLGMCGGILLSACAGREGRKAQLAAALGYNGGRLISYTVLGAVFGALGTVLTYTLSTKSMLFTMLGLVVAFLGLNMWGLLPALPSLPSDQGSACRLPDKLRRQTPLLVGLLTGFMPCGALYAAWLCAMSSGSAGNGALLMLAFSLGTVPLMLLFASLGALLPHGWTKHLRKLGAVLVTSMGLKMLIGGLLLLRGYFVILFPKARDSYAFDRR